MALGDITQFVIIEHPGHDLIYHTPGIRWGGKLQLLRETDKYFLVKAPGATTYINAWQGNCYGGPTLLLLRKIDSHPSRLPGRTYWDVEQVAKRDYDRKTRKATYQEVEALIDG